jgi:hypothetical protein
MVKIVKVEKKPEKSIQLKVSDTVTVSIVYDGKTYSVVYNGKALASIGGNFEDWTFNVEDYSVTLKREELESMMSQAQT